MHACDPTAATTVLINAGYTYTGTGIGDPAAYWTYPASWPERPDGGRRVHHFIRMHA